ncbi:MAG: hypothetical protein ACSHW0_03000 [Thalassotalea sp.]
MAFEALYVKTYGKEKHAALIESYSLTISPIKSSDFHLLNTSSNSATFQGPDSTELTIVNTAKGWAIELENTKFQDLERLIIVAC